MLSIKMPTIGLVELPSVGFINNDGNNMISDETKGLPLVSKQILMSNLRASGFDVHLIDLRQGTYQEEYGKFLWRNTEQTKVYYGRKIQEIDPLAFEVWGVTNNFSQQREIACLTIKHLVKKGRPVIVGGSDAIAEPKSYLGAGASAIVLDKSGAANAAIVNYILRKTPREELSGVILTSGNQPPLRVKRSLHPQEWPIPEASVIEQCLGTQLKNIYIPNDRLKIGSIIPDIGCDRHCDFCQTPKYRLGYKAMSPEKIKEWLVAQKNAGANSMAFFSDQFLGRILNVKKGGRDDILEIVKCYRELGLATYWENGMELKKATLGRGITSDVTPDEELIDALWGWDGKTGCYSAFIPAERPLFGRENYAKLLSWQEHCNMVKAIAHAGVPNISYGVVIGFADDNDDSFLQLEEAIIGLHEDIRAINPSVNFLVYPQTLTPIPGTSQWKILKSSGLLRFDDPSVLGGIWISAIDTHYLTYEQVADWQARLAQIGTPHSGL